MLTAGAIRNETHTRQYKGNKNRREAENVKRFQRNSLGHTLSHLLFGFTQRYIFYVKWCVYQRKNQMV